MKFLSNVAIAAIFAATISLAHAQAPTPNAATLQQNLDSGLSNVTTTMSDWRNAIMGLNNKVIAADQEKSALTAQLATITKERDDLLAAKKAAAPAPMSPMVHPAEPASK